MGRRSKSDVRSTRSYDAMRLRNVNVVEIPADSMASTSAATSTLRSSALDTSDVEMVNYEENVQKRVVQERITSTATSQRSDDSLEVAVISIGTSVNGGTPHQVKITETRTGRKKRPYYVRDREKTVDMNTNINISREFSTYSVAVRRNPRPSFCSRLLLLLSAAASFCFETVKSAKFWLIVMGLGYLTIGCLLVICNLIGYFNPKPTDTMSAYTWSNGF